MRLSTAGSLFIQAVVGAGLLLAPSSARSIPVRNLHGTLEVVWRESHEGAACAPVYRLASEDGSRTLLASNENQSSFRKWIGRAVAVSGSDAAGLPGGASFYVRSMIGDERAPLTSNTGEEIARGFKPYLTILCRFADKPKTPKPASYFNRLLTDRKSGLSSYYQQISYGNLSLAGSRAVGWFNLPRASSAYNPGPNFDLDLALADAVELAGSQVEIGEFAGINVVFNVPAFGAAVGGYGGRIALDVGGGRKSFGVTWLSYVDQALFAHEIGHTLGLPHSSGPYGQTYDSNWDVMSQSYVTRSGKFGYVAQDTIAYHKHLLGWVPDSGMTRVDPGRARTITLRPLCHGDGCQLITIPIGSDGTRWYTVEARLRSGLDKRLPGDGVVLHLVDTKRGDRIAEVVDIDRNGNPNDKGSLWTPGERFQDSANAVIVSVLSRSGDEYQVEIRNKS